MNMMMMMWLNDTSKWVSDGAVRWQSQAVF